MTLSDDRDIGWVIAGLPDSSFVMARPGYGTITESTVASLGLEPEQMGRFVASVGGGFDQAPSPQSQGRQAGRWIAEPGAQRLFYVPLSALPARSS